jgi:hypothetical protein
MKIKDENSKFKIEVCFQLASPPVLSNKFAIMEFQFRRKKQNLGIISF